jgi:hypothetical protein
VPHVVFLSSLSEAPARELEAARDQLDRDDLTFSLVCATNPPDLPWLDSVIVVGANRSEAASDKARRKSPPKVRTSSIPVRVKSKLKRTATRLLGPRLSRKLSTARRLLRGSKSLPITSKPTLDAGSKPKPTPLQVKAKADLKYGTIFADRVHSNPAAVAVIRDADALVALDRHAVRECWLEMRERPQLIGTLNATVAADQLHERFGPSPSDQ